MVSSKSACSSYLDLKSHVVANVSNRFLSAREVVPSTVVNNQDHGAVVTIAAAFGLVTGIIFLNVRLLIRWPWQSLFGLDDAAAAIASVSQDSAGIGFVHHADAPQ